MNFHMHDIKDHTKESSASLLCPDLLNRLISRNHKNPNNLVLLCIGTDRIIGDSLGPLIGSMLSSCTPGFSGLSRRFYVYGTLQKTVHALNLSETALLIEQKHADSIVIAIDASLGSPDDIGSVFVRSGMLHPGAGVDKKLPPMGDISITGIVGAQSRHPYLTLQTVRLFTIMQMAEQICSCIRSISDERELPLL